MRSTRILALLLALTACDSERPDSRRAAAVEPPGSQAEAGGTHRRVTTAHGPVHLWIPARFSRDGDIVVYIHGHLVDVDEAWRAHRLASQFAASGLDALFIAIEAPATPSEPVSWSSLSEVLGTTHRLQPLPDGRVIVVGHAAARRTLVPWLVESQLDTLVLVDAVRGEREVERYRAWLMERPDRRLVFVGEATRAWTDRLHAALPESVRIEGMPGGAVPHRARAIYVRPGVGHLALTDQLAALLQLARTPAQIRVAGR